MKLTPMMDQYWKLKEQYKDAVLFFRLGDFYEVFYDEAKEVSKLLNLTLTARNGVPMCGVPFHAVESYISRLTKAGKKIAICEQLSDPSIKDGSVNIVERDVIRVVTPGTTFDERIVDQKSNRYIAALKNDGEKYALALCDATTGEFRIAEFLGNADLKEELARARPVEIISEEKDLYKNIFPDSVHFAFQIYDEPKRILLEHFKTQSLEVFGVEDKPLAVFASALLLSYIKQSQKAQLNHIDSLQYFSGADAMHLDISTMRNLEIFETLREQKREGSLVWVLDQTKTGMGARMLRKWLMNPLLKKDEIEERACAAEFLINNSKFISEGAELLGSVLDVERLIGRIGAGAGSARDLTAIRQSLAMFSSFQNLFQNIAGIGPAFFKQLAQSIISLKNLAEFFELLKKSIAENPPISVREGGLIQSGFSKELDELRLISREGKTYIQQIESREKERTGIQSLKVRYNQVFGYYIEITKANLDRVPQDYIRKQTLANAERFVTPELKEYEDKVINAEEKINALEYQLFLNVREEAAKHIPELQKYAEVLAVFDVIASLARVARSNKYVKPVMVSDSNQKILKIKSGRHPVLECLETGRFVPNDVNLDGSCRFALVTGPNMGGKSVYLKQTALIQLMAQIGSFVPAESAELSLADRIFTRIGASDHLVKGQSTFMVEMSETAYILRNATSRSLIILDEIGRGTSTYDGVSLAWAISEYLHDKVQAFTLFASHYHELIVLIEKLKYAKNLSVAVREKKNEDGSRGIVFLYKVVEGGIDRSYGIEVAKLAGLPTHVIAKAMHILRDLEEGIIDQKIREEVTQSKFDENQMNLFLERKHRVLDEIQKLKTEEMTPIEALMKIEEWKKM